MKQKIIFRMKPLSSYFVTIRNLAGRRAGVPFTILAGLLLTACNDMFELKPEDSLVREDFYRDIHDADAAVIGIYGQFMNLAESYVIWNELRGDLMEVTANADIYLQQINTHEARQDNPYIDPKPFYQVILSCNDALDNFMRMREENKLDENAFNERYADIAALRCWLYMQLGIHFGTIPYVTDPLEDATAVQDPGRFPMVDLDELIPELIATLEALPTLENYPAGSSMRTTVDGYSTEPFFVPKRLLLGDLYLWAGQYRKAAEQYKPVMDFDDFDRYKVRYADVVNNNDLAVGYLRFREQDINTLINNNEQGWRSIFARDQDRLFFDEWIWQLPFSSGFAPENPFIGLFSPSGGQYLVRPSVPAVAAWDSQVQLNDFPFDARGLFSWQEQGSQPVIRKYLYNYSPLEPLEKDGKWFLYRVAAMHLHFAEAANRDGRHKLAWALLNQGIKTTFDTDPGNSDQTNKQATFDVFPYNFDARQGNSPHFRDLWYRNVGVRGRAYLQPVEMPGGADSTLFIEEKLIDEAALELAYEGYRWPDLVRIAMRRNDPAFLADRVYEKFRQAGHPEAEAIHSRLMNRENWFLPFKWE